MNLQTGALLDLSQAIISVLLVIIAFCVLILLTAFIIGLTKRALDWLYEVFFT